MALFKINFRIMRKFYLLAFVLVIITGADIYSQSIKGKLYQEKFTGPVTKKDVYFNIYLPEGYDTSKERYPVIYHLHGLSQDRGGVQDSLVPSYFETAYQSGLIGKVIIVFPDGYNDSFWADSKDGSKPAETNLIKELIPRIDSLYRTIPNRAHRIVQGFSMGGFGAAKCVSKYPELFSSAVLYDAALVTWNQLRLLFPSISSGIFGNDESYFNQFSPAYLTAVNSQRMKDSVKVRFVVGYYPSLNIPYRTILSSNGISCEYFETGCAHDLNCLLSKEGINTCNFIALNLPVTYNLTCNVKYNNANGYVLAGVNVSLLMNDSRLLYSSVTDLAGECTFYNIDTGNYIVKASSTAMVNGVNSTDALLIRKYLTGSYTPDSLQLRAADVNGSGTINSTDALQVRRRVAGLDQTFSAGDWIFSTSNVNINGGNLKTEIKGICTGDVNSSYTPPATK